jgi:3-oxoacyl-(acyl-carrier-protein) synthase
MSDWTAGLQAIGEAAEWIKAGEADAVLAGGADCGVHPFAYAAYQQAGYFCEASTAAFVPGEGAAMFLLESRDAANARRVTPYAELRGYASRANAEGKPSATLARALCDVMSAARWSRDSIGYCSVAAASRPNEEGAVRDALDHILHGVPARTTFDQRFGYPLAAAGPIDAALLLAKGTGVRVLSSTLGRAGEAVALGFEMGTQP